MTEQKSKVIDFNTKEDLWSLEHTLAVFKDLIEECEEFGDDPKDNSINITVFECKLLLDAIKDKQN